MLADAVVDLAAVGRRGGHRLLAGQLGAGVAGEVGGAGHQAGHPGEGGVEGLLDGDPGGDGLALLERRQRVLPAVQPAGGPAGGPLVAVHGGGGEPGVPGVVGVTTSVGAVGAVGGDQRVGRPERLVRDAHDGLRAGDVLRLERVAVRRVVVGEVRAGVADVGAQDQQARPVGDGHRPAQPGLQRVEVVAGLAEVLHVPAVGLEPPGDIVAVGECGVAVDRDVVVVVHAHQPTEALVAGQRGGLVADAFHQAAVAGEHEREVVLHIGAEAGLEVALRQGHADGVGEPLAERAGGDLHAGGVADLGVARRGRTPLAEGLDVVQFQPVAGEEQHRVLEDGGVAVGQYETVAVRPVRVGRVVAHHPAVEHMGQRGECHRGALVAALGVERGVHGEAADEVDRLLVLFRGEHASTLPAGHAGGSKVKGTRCQGPRSTRQWAKIWP